MTSDRLPDPKFTGQEYRWSTRAVYVLDTVNPVSWRVFNLLCPDEKEEYEEFKLECASL